MPTCGSRSRPARRRARRRRCSRRRAPVRSSSPRRRSFSVPRGGVTGRLWNGCSGRARRCTCRRGGGRRRRFPPSGLVSGSRGRRPSASGSRRQDDAWRRCRSPLPVGQALARPRAQDGARGHRRQPRADPRRCRRRGPVDALRGARSARTAASGAATIPSAPSRSRFPGTTRRCASSPAADGSVAGDDLGAATAADDRRAPLAARDRPLCGRPREAAAAEPQSRCLRRGAGDARSAHGYRQPARIRACARGRARTVGPAWPSVRARDRRPRRLQARQRSSRAWRGGRGARDAGRAAPGLGAFGGHGRPARR